MNPFDANCDKADSKYSSEDVLENAVLFNELVLTKIFGFLNTKDVLRSRYVCQTWNNVAELVLRKRAVITFSSATEFKQFNETFHDAGTASPFTGVKLTNSLALPSGENSTSWYVSDIEDFCKNWRTHIKYLYLDNIEVCDDHKYLSYEICPGLQSNLTTLIIHCRISITKMTVSLDYLTSIKVLKLYNTVVVDIGIKGNKLTPKEVILSGITFKKDGRILDTIHLNDIIDFSKAKEVHIFREFNPTTSLSLDMQSEVTLESLSLQCVDITNITKSAWIVNGLFTLTGILWNQRNQMTFTSMDFHCGTLDLSILPITLQSLRLSTLEEIEGNSLDLYPRRATALENLTFLSLTEERDTEHDSIISLFRSCPRLSDIFYECHLINPAGQLAWQMAEWPEKLPNLDINELPITVQRVELGIPHRVIGFGIYDLETLIISKWQPGDIGLAQVTNRLKPQNLVIDITSWEKSYVDDHNHFLQLIQAVQEFQIHNGAIFVYLGPVKLTDDFKMCGMARSYLRDIDSSVIPIQYEPHVNVSKNWFRFHKGFGKTIAQSEFQKVRSLLKSNVFSILS